MYMSSATSASEAQPTSPTSDVASGDIKSSTKQSDSHPPKHVLNGQRRTTNVCRNVFVLRPKGPLAEMLWFPRPDPKRTLLFSIQGAALRFSTLLLGMLTTHTLPYRAGRVKFTKSRKAGGSILVRGQTALSGMQALREFHFASKMSQNLANFSKANESIGLFRQTADLNSDFSSNQH
ncbi:hypothetical protein P175DRAFT_0527488 [Aspergillus ochraceoroseus IBT 24754]|uniref:Uncharacterized protein n=1 Tax=Aspergillus ochraceoroseus IBT 24754 TaxID=1392256 RepID=A0A2T5M679_9EURO|nr:uncharacterized protein P175DRAFT_0527488 [Aspergillus ochraceoroseus IBT 24754]PTU24032.1 hypothetical protein P175DRAFT_0527488 [Aspergillus ochraceoroseus IBT 24754]